jgi:hypothetical protein
MSRGASRRPTRGLRGLSGGLSCGSQVGLRVVVLVVGHARGQSSGEVVVPEIEVGVGGQIAVGQGNRAWKRRSVQTSVYVKRIMHDVIMHSNM